MLCFLPAPLLLGDQVAKRLAGINRFRQAAIDLHLLDAVGDHELDHGRAIRAHESS